ncbi:MAG: tryptophan--tRNA ligase [Candidatus Eremiobacteraeota bacterium]|nr:tryptophan--tRNA ligase [Candidatus Eremiobacteraeota bacterium]
MHSNTGSSSVQDAIDIGTAAAQRPRVMSGMRPTGQLHLGHLVGALQQWVRYCEGADAYFEIADLHAYTTGYMHPDEIRNARNEMVVDWLAAGVDPNRSTFFLQSAVPQIGELSVLLGMIVPVSWLQRVPTYKEQIAALGPEIATFGFLGYPLLQLCDIAVFRGEYVPVGRDQVAHLELGREIVRRFNNLYGNTLVEPQATLSEFPEVPGTDGRKMSKSYGNDIKLADSEEVTVQKVRSMITDPKKIRRHDPGNPDICPVFALWKLLKPQHAPAVNENCRSGALGCVQDKGDLSEALNEYLRPLRMRRSQLIEDLPHVERVIAEGSQKARAAAQHTLGDVKRAMKLS